MVELFRGLDWVSQHWASHREGDDESQHRKLMKLIMGKFPHFISLFIWSLHSRLCPLLGHYYISKLCRLMAAATVGAEVTSVWFIFAVAINTVLRQAGVCRNWILMAGGTDQTLMGSLQWKAGLLAVIKLSELPAVGVVATRTVLSEQQPVRFILQMAVATTADTSARRSFAMAGFAVEFGMGADQRKAGQAVIKVELVPTDFW